MDLRGPKMCSSGAKGNCDIGYSIFGMYCSTDDAACPNHGELTGRSKRGSSCDLEKNRILIHSVNTDRWRATKSGSKSSLSAAKGFSLESYSSGSLSPCDIRMNTKEDGKDTSVSEDNGETN